MFRVKSRHCLRSRRPSFQSYRAYVQTPKGRKGLPELPLNPFENAIQAEPQKPKLRKKRAPNKGDRTRINIVNEKLCDSVIERLAPSLMKHMNCDIIDVNPGVGLWSSKLHDAVKPRTHILMEPDADRYRPYLKPLLMGKNSTYKLIPESGLVWDNLRKLESDNYLPNQIRYPLGDPRLEQSNDTLLFIANLGYYPTKSYLGFTSITSLMVHQILSAARTHSLFQGYGLVRMLVWMQDREKKIPLPRIISHRTKATVEAEISCEKIIEVAGSDQLLSATRREHAIDLESARIVQHKMRDAKVETPHARVGKLQREIFETTKTTLGSESLVVREFVEELDELEARYARREFPAWHDEDGNPVYAKPEESQMSKQLKRTPEWTRLLGLRHRRNSESSKANKLERWFSEYQSIISEQSKLDRTESANRQQKLIELDQRFTAWKDDLGNNTRLENTFWVRWDDRMAFHQKPPLLLWDRRDSEPLTVSQQDFSPQQEMCLLDFQPKSLWPIMQGENISNYDYFEFLLAAFFANPKQSVARGLQLLAPGADEWIIPRCPSINDANNSAFRGLDHLPVRTLNQQMLKEIFDAWMSWPFRPSKAEMVVRTGNRNSPDGDDDDLGYRVSMI